MKVPELIKKAVLEQDWVLICKVYTAITGEELAPPPPPAPPEVDLLNMDISEDLLNQIGNHLESDKDSQIIKEAEEIISKKKIISSLDDFKIERDSGQSFNEDGKVQARKESIQIPTIRKNLFNDDLSVEQADLKKNNPKLQEVYSKTEHKSTRDLIERPNTKDETFVKCSLCDKEEIVSSRLGRGYDPDPRNNTYRCTSCSTPSGRDKALRLKRQREQTSTQRQRR